MLPPGSELAAALRALPDIRFPDIKHGSIVYAILGPGARLDRSFGPGKPFVHFLFT